MKYFYNPEMVWVIGMASTPVCLATQDKKSKNFIAHLNSVSYQNLMRIFASLDDYNDTIFLEVPFFWKYFNALYHMAKSYFDNRGVSLQKLLACDLSKIEEALNYYANEDTMIDDCDDYYAKDLCYKFIQDTMINLFMLFLIQKTRNPGVARLTIDELIQNFPDEYSRFESDMNLHLQKLQDVEVDFLSKNILQILNSRPVFDFDYLSTMLLDNFGLDAALEDITNALGDEEDFALVNCNVLNSGFEQQYFSEGVVLTTTQKERYLKAIECTKFFELLPQKYKDAYRADDSLLLTIEPIHLNTINNIVEKYHYEYYKFFNAPYIKMLKEKINDTEQLTNAQILDDFTLLKKVKDIKVTKFSEMFIEICELLRNDLYMDYFMNLFLGRELYLPVTRDFLSSSQLYDTPDEGGIQAVHINPMILN